MPPSVHVDDLLLAEAAAVLGTDSAEETVRAALTWVTGRRLPVEHPPDDPFALGVGPDITDVEVMRDARR